MDLQMWRFLVAICVSNLTFNANNVTSYQTSVYFWKSAKDVEGENYSTFLSHSVKGKP